MDSPYPPLALNALDGLVVPWMASKSTLYNSSALLVMSGGGGHASAVTKGVTKAPRASFSDPLSCKRSEPVWIEVLPS